MLMPGKYFLDGILGRPRILFFPDLFSPGGNVFKVLFRAFRTRKLQMFTVKQPVLRGGGPPNAVHSVEFREITGVPAGRLEGVDSGESLDSVNPGNSPKTQKKHLNRHTV